MVCDMELLFTLLGGLAVGAAVGALWSSAAASATVASSRTEAALLRERVVDLEAAIADDAQTAAALTPLRDALGRVERQVGTLNSSTVRGAWGEVQLRRVLEHAGLLARCDFEEQVCRVSRHDRQVRPDVVVRLPGDKHLVVDSKAPMG